MQASSNREENRTVLSFMAHLSLTFFLSFLFFICFLYLFSFESIEHAGVYATEILQRDTPRTARNDPARRSRELLDEVDLVSHACLNVPGRKYSRTVVDVQSSVRTVRSMNKWGDQRNRKWPA